MKSVACCPLTPPHLAAVVKLDQRCFGGLWTLAGYERELASPNSDLLVLEQLGHDAQGKVAGHQGSPPDPASSLIGVGCCWAILDEAHITLLGIDPQVQGQGLGQWLLGLLLVAARDRGLQRATLEVRASNAIALSLYEKFGFQVAGRRQHYYNDGEDALILWLSGLSDATLAPRLRQWGDRSHQRLCRQGWQPFGLDQITSGHRLNADPEPRVCIEPIP
ncbi:MAG: ribosomal protein S18-alanine N-acetyltransferase [Leptolyngbya sp. RL_3_1]|nr:ribosomal protein S18-alanine N-acetyltransferase [Leptolyngbya sp. RL_3_1]